MPPLQFLQLQQKDVGFRTLPAYRPDKLLQLNAPIFKEALVRMEARYGRITDMASLKAAVRASLEHFKSAGCLLSDHGFITFNYRSGTDAEAEAALAKVLRGETATAEEAAAYMSALLRFLAGEYTRLGMGMQLHLGAIRNNNTASFRVLGPDTGFDSIGELTAPAAISRFLDDLAQTDTLPNTVLYCLNPGDNPMLATMAVNFAPRVQLGSAWWFNDTLRGINNQLDELVDQGLLGTFVGMLTDSRSFSSFSRHEYFRRILCARLAGFVRRGEYPAHTETLGKMVEDICYNNAARFFHLV